MRISMSHTPILDHGEIELLNVMGSDAEIIQAARVSYTGQKRKRSARQYAEQIGQWVEEHFPDTWEAFVDYRLDAHTFSGPEMEALRRHLTGDVRENVLEDIKVGGRLSDREIAAFAAALGQ